MTGDELLDVLAADGTKVAVKRRADVHRDGDWHGAFHLWVLCGDELLLQRRGAHKQAWPNRLDATAAGHLAAGEAVLDGLREAEEELGVRYAPEQLTPCGTFTVDETQPDGTINREFQHVFAVRDDRPLEAFTDIARDELDGLVAIRMDAFAGLLHGTPAEGRAWDGTAVTPVTVQPDELVPAPYLVAVIEELRVRELQRGE